MNNNLKKIREEKNLTQKELSEKSKISLRTIQRIESGSILKGHTLKKLSESLNVNTKDLIEEEKLKNSNFIERVKEINTATLLSLIIPYGTILIPFLMIRKTKNIKSKELAKEILSFQIIWTISLSTCLIISTFLNGIFNSQFPFIIVVLLLFYVFNIFVLIKNSKYLTILQKTYNPLKIKLL